MSLSMLRRMTSPVAVWPQPQPVENDDQPKPEPPSSSPAVSPPACYTPGTCWHPGHISFDGIRYGVTPHRDLHTAALTRCHHSNPDGC